MKINWLNIWTGGSAILLVGTEAVGIAAVLAWALVGLMHLPGALSLGLIVVCILAGLFGTAAFALQVHRTEPLYEREARLLPAGLAASGRAEPGDVDPMTARAA